MQAAVAVSGAPNQTFNVILPSETSFSSGGSVVNLSGFEHNAGATPAVGSGGAGIFDVGAAVDRAPAGGGQQGQASGGADAIARAFTQRSPIVNIVVSYN